MDEASISNEPTHVLRHEEAVAELCSLWQALAPSRELSVEDIAQLHRYVIRFDLSTVRLALATGIDYYLYSREETVEFTVKKIGGICHYQRLEEENPELALFHRLHFILRKRLGVTPVDETYREPGDIECDQIAELLELALRNGVPLKELEVVARAAKTVQHLNTAVVEHVRQAVDKRNKPDLVVQVNITTSA